MVIFHNFIALSRQVEALLLDELVSKEVDEVESESAAGVLSLFTAEAANSHSDFYQNRNY